MCSYCIVGDQDGTVVYMFDGRFLRTVIEAQPAVAASFYRCACVFVCVCVCVCACVFMHTNKHSVMEAEAAVAASSYRCVSRYLAHLRFSWLRELPQVRKK